MKSNENRSIKSKVNLTTDKEIDFDDELPDEIDFTALNQIENPIRKKVTINLDSDLAVHFKNSRHLNQFLRLQLKSFAIIK